MVEVTYNFSAGPGLLPASVRARLAQAIAAEASLAEMSHRSLAFAEILEATKAGIRRHLGVDDAYEVLFLMGGARLQFDWIARNFLKHKAHYVVSGLWSAMAADRARAFGHEVSTQALGELEAPKEADYAFICSNETVDGIKFGAWPESDVPLVIDASSDIFSAPVRMDSVGLLFAGAQKNLGIAGVTVVVIRKDFLAKAQVSESDYLTSYKAHAKAGNLLTTPPVVAIAAVKYILDWIEGEGGVATLAQRNRVKADLIYRTIDESVGFYRCDVPVMQRSVTNVVFDLPDETALSAFLVGAHKRGLINLKGHRTKGGIRASLYNAMPLAGAQKLAQYMKEFQKEYCHGS